ncbi:MAG: hypothetical protein WCG81_07845 [Candidatus Angelobacter sp.]
MAILKLLDKFLSTVPADDKTSYFYPKAALLRFHKTDDPKDHQWRIWFGSRNLTRALNWETGLVLVSRPDGKGQVVEGLAAVVQALAARAKLNDLTSRRVRAELSKLTWECPAGCEVKCVRLLRPGLEQGFPNRRQILNACS